MAVPKLLLDVFGDMTTTGEMVRRFTFWRAFLCLAFLGAVGNSVISFARDLTVSVGASASLAAALLCFAVLLSAVLPVSGEEELTLASQAAVLMDADTGTVLYQKNMHQVLYPASITKLMTELSTGLPAGLLLDRSVR